MPQFSMTTVVYNTMLLPESLVISTVSDHKAPLR